MPVRRMRTGSVSSASAGTSTTVTPSLCAAAAAAARSCGAGTPSARHSWADIVEVVTPSGSRWSSASEAPVASSRKKTPSRSTGVKRQSSSRPCGTGKSATSKDVVRSARDWSGTIVAALSVCAPVGGALGGQQAHQPTAPSICSSMRRLSSRAYSMGSSLAMGSTNPRTIIAIASCSDMPRDMR